MQEDRARAEALLFFNGKRDFLDEDEAVYASEDVDPAIRELVDSVQEQLPLLQKQAGQLSDGIEVRPVYTDVPMHHDCCSSVLAELHYSISSQNVGFSNERCIPTCVCMHISCQCKHNQLTFSASQVSVAYILQEMKIRGKQGPRDGPMAMQQLYNALNLQKEVALSQVAVPTC